MTAMERCRVVVADDHPLFRDAMVALLRSSVDADVVAQVGSGREALAAIREHDPDVAVVDLRMADGDGVQVCRTVIRERRRTRVLIVSGYDDSELVHAALAAGASGYVAKDRPVAEVAGAFRLVARGGTAVVPGLLERSGTRADRRSDAGRPLLTGREREVLALLAEGESAPEIAHRLALATSTVKSHLANLYEKLGVSDRAAAVAEAMRRGLLR